MAGDIDTLTQRSAQATRLARRRDGFRPRQRRHVGRRACLQGHSLWRLDGRRQPLHAAAQARTVDRRARGDRLCRPLAAGACRPAAAGAGDGVGAGRHPAGRRGLPDAACLDARPRQRQASGHGLAAWRRLLLRLGQLAALRQHPARAAQRRRGRGGQPSPQHLRPSRSVGRRAASASPSPAMPACSTWSRRWNGCASMPRRFGGDPGNVTIFGQSGGGGKVSALLAMPRAKGLFHKAIMQSGASVRFAERERTTRLADAVLKHLGLRPDQLDALQALPLERLQEAVVPAQATLPRAAPAAARPLQFRSGDRRHACCPPSPSIPRRRRCRTTSR